jgi:tetratricopeptide (TPR) repeat protein
VLAPLPKNLQKNYEKLWQRFRAGKDDSKLTKDTDKLLTKNPNQVALLILSSYLDIYNDRRTDGQAKLEKALGLAPFNRIALAWLAEFAFARGDYARAGDFYSRLLEVDPSRSDVEPKREKAMLVATENLIRSASEAEEANRLADAEYLYQQALRMAPREPLLHEKLGDLLSKQNKWDQALMEFQKEREFAATPTEADARIAEAFVHLGRTEEARVILERLKKSGSVDSTLEAKLAELADLGRWGQDIAVFRDILAAPQLSRAQAAALLMRYFPQIAEFRQTPQVITDAQGSWALTEIQATVGVGLFDLRPNHTYEPGAPITRVEFAAALARLTRLIRLSVPQAPPIPTSDVGPRNTFYRDVQLVLALGLMQIDDNGTFSVNGPVAGGSAVRSVEQLLSLSRGK